MACKDFEKLAVTQRICFLGHKAATNNSCKPVFISKRSTAKPQSYTKIKANLKRSSTNTQRKFFTARTHRACTILGASPGTKPNCCIPNRSAELWCFVQHVQLTSYIFERPFHFFICIGTKTRTRGKSCIVKGDTKKCSKLFLFSSQTQTGAGAFVVGSRVRGHHEHLHNHR